MKIWSIVCLILLLSGYSYSQLLLTSSEVLRSPDKFEGKFLGMIGTVRYLETFINGNGDRAMKFQLSEDNGDFVTVRLAFEELWVTDGEKVQISGIFHKDYGLGLERNLVIINQGSYGESILPYREDQTTKFLDGLLRKLIK